MVKRIELQSNSPDTTDSCVAVILLRHRGHELGTYTYANHASADYPLKVTLECNSCGSTLLERCIGVEELEALGSDDSLSVGNY